MNEETVFKSRTNLSQIKSAIEKIKGEAEKVIVGQEEMVTLLIAALFSNGHVLIEGVPGVAKTLTAKLLAKTIKIGFSRIQFTPDLMPSDIIGTTIFNEKKAAFEFKKGPLFSNLILIDEINRAPAKTQSALLEAMEERQITYNGKKYIPGNPFFVVATQNPIEYEGTYRLPEAQLDRFLFKINVSHPSVDEEMVILSNSLQRKGEDILQKVKSVLTSIQIEKIQKIIHSVAIDENLIKYITEIINRTRNDSSLFLGASPRASLAIMNSAQAIAVMNGRDFVIPEDIKYVAHPCLRHRIILTPEREMEGKNSDDIIDEIIQSIEVPR